MIALSHIMRWLAWQAAPQPRPRPSVARVTIFSVPEDTTGVGRRASTVEYNAEGEREGRDSATAYLGAAA